jgi:hypothetical protein
MRAQELTLLLNGKSNGDPGAFAERWAADSLLAEAARAGLLHPSRASQVERSVLARVLLESLLEGAKHAGEPNQRELEAITKERWFEVNRPEAAQTTHFVVLREGNTKGGADSLARALADAVRGAKTPAEFTAVVERYPKNGRQVVVESLPPVTRDGRSLRLDSSGHVIGAGLPLDEQFARAANLLQTPGEQSGLVRTAFGVHVIFLERKIPAVEENSQTLKDRFAPEIVSRRARAAMESCIQDSRRNHSVVYENSFQQAITQLQGAQ